METDALENGFYWVVLVDESDEAEVAEYIDGEWFVTGSRRAYDNQNNSINILSGPLTCILREE